MCSLSKRRESVVGYSAGLSMNILPVCRQRGKHATTECSRIGTGNVSHLRRIAKFRGAYKGDIGREFSRPHATLLAFRMQIGTRVSNSVSYLQLRGSLQHPGVPKLKKKNHDYYPLSPSLPHPSCPRKDYGRVWILDEAPRQIGCIIPFPYFVIFRQQHRDGNNTSTRLDLFWGGMRTAYCYDRCYLLRGLVIPIYDATILRRFTYKAENTHA